MLEREIDRHNEKEAGRILECLYPQYRFHCLSAIDSYDMIITRNNKLAGIAEVKTRKSSYNKMFLPVRKYLSLTSRIQRLSRSSDELACLYIWFVPKENLIGLLNLKEFNALEYEIKVCGRNDRNLTNDLEPMWEVGDIKWVSYCE